MYDTKQKDRILELETPLGENVLLINEFTGVETISDIYRFQIDARSENKAIDPNNIIGKGVTVGLELYDDSDQGKRNIRYFHGIVDRFGKTKHESDNAFYSLELVPWLALLSHRANCRIFQDLTAVDIIKRIFDFWKSEYPGFVAYHDKTSAGQYRTRDYCVQYRETDLAFVSRLMEEEGIFYYFKHEQGKHTLIFGDAAAAHAPCPIDSKAPFFGDEGEQWQPPEDSLVIKAATKGLGLLQNEGKSTVKQAETDVLSTLKDGVLKTLTTGLFGGVQFILETIITQLIKAIQRKMPEQHGVKVFQVLQQIRPGRVTLRDRHFEMPRKTLEVSELTRVTVGDKDKLEIYDYPGDYAKFCNKPAARLDQVEQEGKKQVRVYMESEETPHWIISGISREGAFSAGFYFDMTEHKHKPTNGRYILTSVEHSIVQAANYRSSEENEAVAQKGGPYKNKFTCIPASWTYRPPRKTARAVIHGLQTATVVGKQKEEIWVDKYGRVRVQFHWDRDALPHPENASCWIRVAQIWAGKRWGAYFWPRIGQEVVVAFLEGDPDRPIIIGSVYNYEQMPPYIGDGPDNELPHDPTVSGIKTCSTQNGEGFNELRFNDRKDKEQIFWHAQRDRDSLIRHDDKEWIGNERHIVVGMIDPDKKVMQGDQFEAVCRDKHAVTLRDHFEHVAGKMELLIGGSRQNYVRGADPYDPGPGSLDLSITGDKRETVGGDCHHVVEGDRYERIKLDQNLIIKGNQQESVTGSHALSAGDIHLKAGTKIILEAGAQISLKVGGNFVDIGSAGVSISGTMVYINSGGSAGSGGGSNPKEAKEAIQAKPVLPKTPDVWTSRPGQPSSPDAATNVPRLRTPDELWPIS